LVEKRECISASADSVRSSPSSGKKFELEGAEHALVDDVRALKT